jgi:hypothetical protein
MNVAEPLLLYLGDSIHWTWQPSTRGVQGPLIGREHVSSPAVAHDPWNVLNHDQEPMLDSVMVASSARNDATHTTHTDDSLKPIKRVHHDLDHTTDMVLHSIDR